METWIIVLCVVGGFVGYTLIAGVVFATLQRLGYRDGEEGPIAAFWPLVAVIAVPAGLAWCAARIGAWSGERIVDAFEALLAWRRRPRLPRVTVRKGGR